MSRPAAEWPVDRQWQTAKDWAERGIAVYGDVAARPEVVEDLHKRVAYAAAKLEVAERPKPRKRTLTVGQPLIESLRCESCGSTFERERTRDRKRKTCPVCRGLATPVVSS
jgi:hypothetical protein